MNDRKIEQNNENHIICFPHFEINDVVKRVVEKGKAGMESGFCLPSLQSSSCSALSWSICHLPCFFLGNQRWPLKKEVEKGIAAISLIASGRVLQKM